MNIKVEWPALKEFVDARSVALQYVTIDDFYYLVAFDGPFALNCTIRIESPASADQAEFEAGYLSESNKTPTARYAQVYGSDDVSPCAVGEIFTQAQVGEKAHDLVLDDFYGIRGGMVWSDHATPGDWAKCELIDRDNVLGYGPGLVLKTYIKKWYLIPGQLIDIVDNSLGFVPVPGLVFRTTYYATDIGVRNIIANLLTYKKDNA